MDFLILNRQYDRLLSHNIEDYPEGIVIPIDKPYRWTSADVIRKIKFTAIRHFGKKNLKVGHAGTLDPLATGVLLVCIGKATKMAETLQSHDKEYEAGITFGATTPSYDLEKEIDRFFPHEKVSRESIEAALPGFIGEQDQIAPLFSAKSVDGVRAYELARKLYKEGGSIDEAAAELIRTARINISELELLSFEPSACRTADKIGSRTAYGNEDPDRTGNGGCSGDGSTNCSGDGSTSDNGASGGSYTNASSRINVTDNSSLGLPRAVIRMACSKGTYVRAFARDLGEALDSGAHLDSLRRTRSGIFRASESLSIDEAINILAAD